MNLIFQNDYFSEEEKYWSPYAQVVSGLCKEEYLDRFCPTVARGTIAFHNTTKNAFKYKGWPDLTWPFNNDWKVYDYDYLYNCSDLLNSICEFETNIGVGYYDKPMWRIHNTLHSSGGELWIRSISGSKQFTGGVFNAEQFKTEVDYLHQKDITDLKFVTSDPKIIGKEFRVVIVGHEVVSMSQYMDRGEPKTSWGVPLSVQTFSERWMNRHKMMFPDSYVLDVCEFEDDYKVVEVNNLLTSGWYDCDVEEIIRSICCQVHKTLKRL